MWIVLPLLVVAAIAALLFVPALKGYRTLILGYATTVIGGLIPLASDVFTYLQTVDWTQYVSPKGAAIAALGVGLMIIVLRHMTKGPVGEK